MNQNNIYFTLGEFAKIHNINKRTLHYYDEIQLFRPSYVGENGYRYYTYNQSMKLETILAYREIGMSIAEIQEQLENPSISSFIALSNTKIKDIEKTMKKLSTLKKMLQKKNELLCLSQHVRDGQIDIIELEEMHLFMSKLDGGFENLDDIKEVPIVLDHLRLSKEYSSFTLSCGSFISLDKLKRSDFSSYDGLFTEVNNNRKQLYVKPKGKYLRGFSIGDWNKIPVLYKRMLAYAKTNQIELGEYAFERGINEITITNISEYITEITIACK